MNPNVTCKECGRVFDLSDVNQANEWYYGHDCEDPEYSMEKAYDL